MLFGEHQTEKPKAQGLWGSLSQRLLVYCVGCYREPLEEAHLQLSSGGPKLHLPEKLQKLAQGCFQT